MTDLVTRVCAVMADVGNIEKDKTNDHFKYAYTSAEAVRAKVQKACAKHQLMLKVEYSQENVTPTQSVMKSTCSVSIDGATWVLLGEGWGAGVDRGEKSPMKACTSAAKYAIANAFCIALGDDPEADAETDRAAAKPKPREQKPQEQRAPEAAPSTERILADGLRADFAKQVTGVDSMTKWLNANAAPIKSLPEAARTYVFTGCGAYAVTAQVVGGLTKAEFMDAWNAALMQQGAQS